MSMKTMEMIILLIKVNYGIDVVQYWYIGLILNDQSKAGLKGLANSEFVCF